MTLEAAWGRLMTAQAEHPAVQKVAKLPEDAEKQVRKEIDRLLSRSALMKLRSAFGVIGLPFFEFYRELALARRLESIEAVFPEGRVFEEFRQRTRMLIRTKISPTAQNQASAVLDDLKPWFRAIERNPEDRSAWRRIVRQIGPLLPLIAKDKGVYIKGQERGAERWFVYRMMRPKEQQLEDIKDNDPSLYEAIQKHRGRLRDIEDTIQLNLMDEGLPYERKFIMGRTVFVAQDPRSGERIVYDWANQGVPMDRYLEKRKAENRVASRQGRVFPDTRALNQLRRFSDEAVEALPGALDFVSLTDDKAKKSALTRDFPVKIDPATGRQVIVQGRFKGIYLDEMVNAAGRMIEGTAFNFNPKTNRFDRIESVGPDGKLLVRAEREPYVTVAEIKQKVRGQRRPVKVQKLFVKIPSGKAFTELRRSMRKLSAVVSSVEYIEGSRSSEFYFAPKDFNIVQDALQAIALSEGAAKARREYNEQLAMAEMATARENLGFYTLDAIGGFKSVVKTPSGKLQKPSLLVKQQQALAWMEARGNNGVCALGTGVGKTISSIAMMQKLKRDGLAEEGNGKFLYVCPKALRGNIKKEIWKFLTDEERQDLVRRLDIMTYPQFRNAWKRNPNFANDYIAIFFDEAQELRKATTQTSKAAQKINHPRKILLTASPIEKEPMDAYVLAAIANNEDVAPRTPGRREMLRFQRRFTETIGGRTVGVKQDPMTKADLQTWVKQNIFYGDKQDIEEFELPKLSQQTVSLAMPPEVETLYRETATEFKNVLRGMVARFRYRGVDPETGRKIPEARERRIALMFSAKLAPLIKRLNEIANFPERFVPEVAMRHPDGSTVTGYDGTPLTEPTGNLKLQASLDVVATGWENGGRSILFADDSELVTSAARYMSQRMVGVYHMAALSRGIHVFQNGEELSMFMGFDMPFREKRYKRFMDQPANDTNNKNYERAFWQSFVFNEIATNNPSVVSVALHGQVYQTGQNLQAFSNVIHLDRDTWNSEDMKQRTARAWRQGQENPVSEYTMDVTYDRPTDDLDRTLDEIRGYLQEMDSDLFKQIIQESQHVVLGEEYFRMRRTQARFFTVDRQSMELAMSPYVDNSEAPRR